MLNTIIRLATPQNTGQGGSASHMPKAETGTPSSCNGLQPAGSNQWFDEFKDTQQLSKPFGGTDQPNSKLLSKGDTQLMGKQHTKSLLYKSWDTNWRISD